MDLFESHVLGDKQCCEEDADIILTTCHGSKGLEWDHVQLCDDFLDLSATPFTDIVKDKYGKLSKLRHPSFLKAMPGQVKAESETCVNASAGDKRQPWQFSLYWNNEQNVNCLYVALTRARKTLSVPTSIRMLLHDLDQYHFLVGTFKNDLLARREDETMMMNGSGEKAKKLTKGDVWNLYHDICYPFREELGITADAPILETLFPEECYNEQSQSTETEQSEPGVDVKPSIL